MWESGSIICAIAVCLVVFAALLLLIDTYIVLDLVV